MTEIKHKGLNMRDTEVKSKRRHKGQPITAWITPELNALLSQRASEMGLDKSAIIRAGLSVCLLQPTIIQQYLSGNAAAPTSPSQSGSRASWIAKWRRYVTALESQGRISSGPHFDTPSSAQRLVVTHDSSRILPDVGEWNTKSSKCRYNQNIRNELHAEKSRASVLHSAETVSVRSVAGANASRVQRLQLSKTTLLIIGDVCNNPVVEVPLTNGGTTKVRKVDLPLLEGRRYYAAKSGTTSYAMRSGNARKTLHRDLMPCDGLEIDHRNRDGLDNRTENLRIATRQQNLLNRGMQRSNSTGYRGVSWDARANRYVATIRINGRLVMIGSFIDPADAAMAWDVWALSIRGGDTALNFPIESVSGQIETLKAA